MCKFKKMLLGFMVVLLLSFLAGCSSTNTQSESSTGESSGEVATGTDQVTPGVGGNAVGFIFVGTKDDYGYNQAAYLGSVGVENQFKDLKVLRAENVPETAEAERVMEEMIRAGAKIIFPTSYGHLEPAIEVAKRHPDVAFFHQGGLKNAENVGTYFGTIWESIYLSGVAAAKESETGKLGYIVSVPIPQVLLNVNAFTLGARSVNPDATTNVVFTGSWCDPGQQASAVNSMADQGIDVITQHQDCTKTIIETAQRKGIKTVGYHADASELSPESWITGSIWNWSDLYIDMVKTAGNGEFKGSIYDGKFRGGLKEGIVQLAPFGSTVSEETKTLVEDLKTQVLDGSFHPFLGPVKDQAGNVVIDEGIIPTIEELETTNYFVEGVIGSIPK